MEGMPGQKKGGFEARTEPQNKGQFISGRASSMTLSAWRQRHAQQTRCLQHGRDAMAHGLSSRLSVQIGQS